MLGGYRKNGVIIIKPPDSLERGLWTVLAKLRTITGVSPGPKEGTLYREFLFLLYFPILIRE